VAIGTLPTFWVTTGCFWGFASLALVLPDKRIDRQHSQTTAIIHAFFTEFAGAAKFLGHHRLVLFAFLVFTVTSLTGASFNTLALEFTHEYLGSDEQGFGLLLAARGAGALIGMALLVLLGSRTTSVKAMLYSLAGSGLMFVFLAGARSLTAAALWLLLEGLISTGFSVAARTIQQEHLPTELRGKVLGLSIAISQGVYMLAAGVAGVLATQIALPLIFVAAGSMLMVFALLYPLIIQRAVSKEAEGDD
jgi:MFS family permease